MSTKPDSGTPDVVERGGYSETSGGPAADTTAYITGTPLGSVSRADDPPLVTFDTEKKPEPVMLSRDKLTHGKPAPLPDAEPEGLSRTARMVILAGLVVLSLGAVLSSVLFGADPVVPPAEETPAAPAGPEAPREIDGVPVERGMNRKPLPPKQK